MELIHVITTNQEGVVAKIESFAVVEEQLKLEVNQEAEKAFIAEVISIRYPQADTETDAEVLEEMDSFQEELSDDHVENGYFEEDGRMVSLVHNWVENVQL